MYVIKHNMYFINEFFYFTEIYTICKLYNPQFTVWVPAESWIISEHSQRHITPDFLKRILIQNQPSS